MKVVENNVLVVPPFDCAWLSGEGLQFAEAGKGCVAFDARGENDVTVVFKEHAGCKHYRTDSDPNYTVIIGSNLNRRLKIAANGRTVVDVAGPVLSPSIFERYWISVDEGVVSVGKGEPGQNLVYKWVDPQPNCKVQFVGLSSWDKHVGYRNISVIHPPLLQQQQLHPVSSISASFAASDAQWSVGVANYLESHDLADFHFVLHPDNRCVPAHRALLVAAAAAASSSASKEVVCSPFVTSNRLELSSVDYPALRALLRYIYTGKAQVDREHLVQLHRLADFFGIQTLASQCEQFMKKTDMRKSIQLVYHDPSSTLPMNPAVLTRLLLTGQFSDLELCLEDHSVCLYSHKLVLSVWSAPFAKMFTNGMKESNRTRVIIKDVHLDAFRTMIRFMYSGRLDLEGKDDAGRLMLPLLILADRYAVHLLQQECHDHLLVCVNEDSACAILQVVSSMPFCESLRYSCEECCAKHFDYCITASASEFKELDAACISRILQHQDLLVTSEEAVLNAVIMWAANREGINGWEDADKMCDTESEVIITGNRMEDLKSLLPLVRFPLMPMGLLQQLELSMLCRHITFLRELVAEAIHYLIQEAVVSDDQKDSCRISNQGRLVSLPRNSLWFTRRLSSFTELHYLCDGDCNGVLYYAGTGYGAHGWMNPVLTKRVTLTASSPSSRYTDPKVLVSRNYQATSFAGPCIEAGQIRSWWRLDLGPEHQLMCNYYSVRQDGSTNFARDWAFQGSGDGNAWTDLRVHKKDHTICRPGQYASWPVHGAKSLVPFRYFRLLLKQPTAAASSPWNLSICYLELYGYLH